MDIPRFQKKSSPQHIMAKEKRIRISIKIKISTNEARGSGKKEKKNNLLMTF